MSPLITLLCRASDVPVRRALINPRDRGFNLADITATHN
jgi:hypothetical protein